jgi:homoserine/homoserine lactone efflux protein
MSIELYLTFAAAAAALMLIPGPNVALIAAASVSNGLRSGLATVAGTSSAMVVQLFLVGAGLNAFLLNLSGWFELLRWAGVIYLVYLGVRLWRAAPAEVGEADTHRDSFRAAYLRGLFVSLTNPKTLFFYGAFFPQFVVPECEPLVQIFVLSLTFLAIAVVIDSGWAFAAAKLRMARSTTTTTSNRLAGSLFIGAGFGLALARKS